MSATTPIGSRVTSTVTPGRTEGSNSPAVRSASPAKNLKIWPARPTSPRASGVVFALFTRQQIAKFGPDAPGFPSRCDRGRRRAAAGLSMTIAERRGRSGDRGGRLVLIGDRVLADDVARVGRVDVVLRPAGHPPIRRRCSSETCLRGLPRDLGTVRPVVGRPIRSGSVMLATSFTRSMLTVTPRPGRSFAYSLPSLNVRNSFRYAIGCVP